MAVGEFTPEAQDAIDLCRRWADNLIRAIPADVYLFGSAIYEGGDQFDAQHSDLDLVVVFKEKLDAAARVERLTLLRERKLDLEIRMVPKLHRTNCSEPGVSIIPITALELQANIHKSGARRFFDRNIFLNLITEVESLRIPGAGTHAVSDPARQALEYAQKIRNQYLAISANETGGIAPFDGTDPLPKALARSAAQLLPDSKAGAWYDTRFGLEYIHGELSRFRSDPGALGMLCKKLSVRRGGRGQRSPLSAQDQLLLAELLYDRAASFPLEPIATWEIRFANVAPTPSEREQLLEKLQDLIPAAEILGVYEGSVIVRLRSARRIYLTAVRMLELGILNIYFETGDIDLVELGEDSSERRFKPQGLIDRIAEEIAAWRPQSIETDAEMEEHLALWLEASWLIDSIPAALVTREARIPGASPSLRADLLVQFASYAGGQDIVIELVHIRNRSRFFHEIERLERIPIPTILVLVGSTQILAGLAGDIQQFSNTDGVVRIVPVALDNG